MRVLIACDSFKDALPADQVCRAIARGLLRTHPGVQVSEMPLSDGGEGVLDIMRRTLSLRPVALEVADPLGRPVMASYGISADGETAVVEMAGASGLQLLSLEERNPLLTSTFGTGQLLAAARTHGAKRALLGIGGSATNDAGVGAAAALGWQFLDEKGKPVKPDGGNLLNIARIIPPVEMPFARMDVLCDVTNPLYGPTGAAWIYGHQKGGNDQSLAQLDAGLRHIAALVEKQTGRKGLAETPGAGAAGGMGFGALAFMNATLKRGIDMVLDLVGFDAAAARADLIITGEGHLDGQSAQGKLIQGVCARAGKVPVIALAGKLSISPEQIKSIGLAAAYSINTAERPLPEMLAATAENLEKTAAALLRRLEDDGAGSVLTLLHAHAPNC
ncbi:MAG TPA: glycerate kinase [Rhizomicrobium sp.]|nr:glycerate kinase [Rhizomicrobium sp.]